MGVDVTVVSAYVFHLCDYIPYRVLVKQRKNSLELIELSSINKVSLVLGFIL